MVSLSYHTCFYDRHGIISPRDGLDLINMRHRCGEADTMQYGQDLNYRR